MKLITPKVTKWVLFLSSSSSQPEERHILDLAYGLMSLESAGVMPSDINIYIDGINRQSIYNAVSLASTYGYEIKKTDDFFTDLADNTHQNIVMFVAGHGCDTGIDSTSPITPHALLSTIKSTPNLNKAIIYLSQCYAGIFNYIKAGRNINASIQARHEPDVVFVGATNLHESLSSSTTEQFINGSLTWVSNLFLLHLFRWFSRPIDIDGDGLHSIMDSYKYAGLMTNRHHKQVKSQGFVRMIQTHTQIEDMEKTVSNPTGDFSVDIHNILKFQSLRENYENLRSINYLHQECWILNSIPAQAMTI